jgi:hypothetical protein
MRGLPPLQDVVVVEERQARPTPAFSFPFANWTAEGAGRGCGRKPGGGDAAVRAPTTLTGQRDGLVGVDSTKSMGSVATCGLAVGLRSCPTVSVG